MSSPPPTAGLPARVAAKPSLNLLDFDGDSTAPPLAQQQEQAPAGVLACHSCAIAHATWRPNGAEGFELRAQHGLDVEMVLSNAVQ